MKKVYNKLVRDKMIDIYKHDIANSISASDFSVQYLEKNEILENLKTKLLEETEELFEVYESEDSAKLIEEIADIIEVLDAMLYHKGQTLEDVDKVRALKKEKRGGFETGLFLESIDYFDEKI
jgi:predicted house-cleaning noncanonical NTP pyrophosphatase (MazG superfamily)